MDSEAMNINTLTYADREAPKVFLLGGGVRGGVRSASRRDRRDEPQAPPWPLLRCIPSMSSFGILSLELYTCQKLDIDRARRRWGWQAVFGVVRRGPIGASRSVRLCDLQTCKKCSRFVGLAV